MVVLRFALSVSLILAGLFNLVVAEAQQAAKIPRIGFLAARHYSPQQEAFLQGLRDRGYVEGRNVVIEYRDAEGQIERLPALAAELVALKVDVIAAAAGTLPALAAKEATRTLPIVFIAVGNPVTSGLVTRVARPGGNLTGLSTQSPELTSCGSGFWAASVRVWHITSRGWDPSTERPLPEVVRVAYPARSPCHHDYRLWRCRHQAQGTGERRHRAADETDRLLAAARGDRQPAGGRELTRPARRSADRRWKAGRNGRPVCPGSPLPVFPFRDAPPCVGFGSGGFEPVALKLLPLQ